MGREWLEADSTLFSADYKQMRANLLGEQCSKNVCNMFSRRVNLRKLLILEEI